MARDSTTLYLRGMPTRLVREAKAAAARRGATLTKLITDTLESALQGGGERGQPIENDFDLDMQWYAKNRSRLVRQYDGEYVAILDERAIDHDRRFEALAERVFRKVGVRAVFMPHVRAGEERVHVRSPRRRSA
ncbi:MAG: DUF5678 domain-containing protein [Candidatus Binatia bacterium]